VAVDDAKTWDLIHTERAAMVETLTALTPERWAEASLVSGWSVHVAAGHILNGAEQTPLHFMQRMAANGFRFNRAMDRDARRAGGLAPTEIIERLRATTTTTNHPPAPVMAMLGEIVVHAEDIRRPLGLVRNASPAAIVACLEMYSKSNFPVGGKKRIDGLRLVATDIDWSCGTGAEVSGAGLSLLLAMTGRPAGLAQLTGTGLDTLRSRVAPA
jgi:uncharacterized protein (TIGR03083 family)